MYIVGFLLRLPFDGEKDQRAGRDMDFYKKLVLSRKEMNVGLEQPLIRFCQCIDILLSKLPLRLDFQNSVPMDTTHGFLSPPPIYIVVCSFVNVFMVFLSLSLSVVICHIVCT